MISRIKIEPFSLEKTMECGQFFRFTKTNDTYIIQASGRIFTLIQKGNFLYFDGVDESFLHHFLRLDDDLEAILKRLDRDSTIHQAIQHNRGLRLIRQDPWECLISFLFSSAKAIPHIRCLIETFCRLFGKKVAWGTYLGYDFPEHQCVHLSNPLEELKAGFRMDYLARTSQCIDRKQLIALKRHSYPEAKKRLMELPGVGNKIADCVLLYSLDFLEAFPIDTWIRKGMEKIYFHGEKVGEKKLVEFIQNYFGSYAGYGQLYLYHYWRTQVSNSI